MAMHTSDSGSGWQVITDYIKEALEQIDDADDDQDADADDDDADDDFILKGWMKMHRTSDSGSGWQVIREAFELLAGGPK